MSLPAGTVTLLFSDIEGSTRLLQQLADDYAAVEAEHRRIMRESCTGAGGHEIDRQGDAFFFSFPRTRDAVSGAVSAQRALATNDWPDGVELKVRMGLHTGEPSVGDEGYLGLDVLEAPSSKQHDVAGERSRTAKVQSLIYPFLILAFGLVGLAWLIKILFL